MTTSQTRLTNSRQVIVAVRVLAAAVSTLTGAASQLAFFFVAVGWASLEIITNRKYNFSFKVFLQSDRNL